MKLLTEGDVIEIEEGHELYAMIPKHFVYSNCTGNFELTHSKAIVSGELSYLAGKYVVTKTVRDGGGTGGDSEIDFYQTGCFSAMIEDISPIGKAKLTWVIETN
jgi:hypothetical protein